MKRALLLSAETPSAIAAVRSLHDAGFDVAVLAEGPFSPAAVSWRCSATHRVGAWRPEDLVTHVLEANPDVIVPVTEGDLVRLAPVRSSVEKLAPLVAPPAGVLDLITDKPRAAALADEVDGATAPYQALLPCGEKVGETEEGDFPVIAKPRRSRVLLDDGTVWGGTAHWVSEKYQLREVHREFSEAGLDTVVQQPVRGTPLLVSLLLRDDGEPALVFVHRRIRQARPQGGPSACAISVAPDERIVAPAVALARQLGVRGVPVQLEFLVPGDDDPVLLDVNPRPWGTLALALDAGVNFFGVAARHALGEQLPDRPPSYTIGLVRHYLPFEVRHVVSVMFGTPPPGRADLWPRSRLQALVDWGFLPTEALVFRTDDPLPAMANVLHLAVSALRPA